MINGLLKHYNMDQLIFKFPFAKKYYEQDFFVSSNNFSAFKLIEGWPTWPGKWLNIFGDAGSGNGERVLQWQVSLVNRQLQFHTRSHGSTCFEFVV